MRLAFFLALVVSCGDDGLGSDAGVDVGVDAGDAGDAGGDAGADATDFTTCEGDCAQTLLSADFGGVVEPFDSAFFGFDVDGSLRVEVYGGAIDECPTMDSPTPDRTLVIPGITPPTDPTPQSVTASLLDFAGTLTSEPILRAASATITPVAADAGFVRFDLEARFDTGTIEDGTIEDATIEGAVFATHCASLDG